MKESVLAKMCANKIVEVMGKQYVHDNFKNAVFASGFNTDMTYMYFAGFKTSAQYKKKPPTSRGWSVYAFVEVNKDTGEFTALDFQKED